MSKKQKTAISPTRRENYSEWYQKVVQAGELAENSPVRGCMVIRPWGYALWENIQAELDRKFKETGHVNAYFPLFIPKSYLDRESEHVEGFAKECAVVTHHRLEEGPEGELVPAGELEEPLVVRPTSETIIGATYARWVQSYRDLPILINQWANVVRWEMRTRLFLRTAEFLWQEGHTVHETAQEAQDEARKMLDLYQKFAEEYMAMPVLTGEKSDSERFPGAVNTYSIEAMMQDRKALQAGTSHFLGQNFSKTSGIEYQSREGQNEFPWMTSWGVSTRLIGGMIMTHADDNGMVMPPRLAPSQVVILPIIRKKKDREMVLTCCDEVAEMIGGQTYHGSPVRVEVDRSDANAGEKGWSWIKKGVPLRIEIGPRDIKSNAVFVGRRDHGPRDKYPQEREAFADSVPELLDEIQTNLFERALQLRNDNTRDLDDYEEFKEFFTPQNRENPEIHGGFAMSHWCGSVECENKIRNELSVTTRVIPFDRNTSGKGECICCGESSPGRVLFAKSY